MITLNYFPMRVISTNLCVNTTLCQGLTTRIQIIAGWIMEGRPRHPKVRPSNISTKHNLFAIRVV